MDKVLKIVLIVFAVFVVVGGFGGDTEDGSSPSDESIKGSTTDVHVAPAQPASFEEQIYQEIIASGISSDMVLSYDESEMLLDVELRNEAFWDNNQLRTILAFDSFDIMTTVTKHPDKINMVRIYGYAPMIDVHGNTEMALVYQANIDLSQPRNTNWEALKGFDDMVQATRNNFDSVHWDPAIIQ